MTRSIAVLGGTGPEGFGLARRWAKAGEKIIIGSRDAKRAREAAEKTKASIPDAQVSGDENSAACAAADLVVLTIPFEGHAALLKQIKPVIRSDAVVVDTTVPLAASVGGRATRTLGVWQGSAAEQAAELVPEGVALVAAFHNVSSELLNGDNSIDCDVIVCSDDKEEAKRVRELALKIHVVRAAWRPGRGRALLRVAYFQTSARASLTISACHLICRCAGQCWQAQSMADNASNCGIEALFRRSPRSRAVPHTAPHSGREKRFAESLFPALRRGRHVLRPESATETFARRRGSPAVRGHCQRPPPPPA